MSKPITVDELALASTQRAEARMVLEAVQQVLGELSATPLYEAHGCLQPGTVLDLQKQIAAATRALRAAQDRMVEDAMAQLAPQAPTSPLQAGLNAPVAEAAPPSPLPGGAKFTATQCGRVIDPDGKSRSGSMSQEYAERQAAKLNAQMHPKVGDGATSGFGSDYYPYEVIEVLTPRKIRLAECDTRKPDFPIAQNAGVYTATLRKSGRWVADGQDMTTGRRFVINGKRYHQDPHR